MSINELRENKEIIELYDSLNNQRSIIENAYINIEKISKKLTSFASYDASFDVDSKSIVDLANSQAIINKESLLTAKEKESRIADDLAARRLVEPV